MKKIVIYHGSDHIIKVPAKKFGKIKNDYGQGFYCTKESTLAAEWACSMGSDGIVNHYELDPKGLKVLRLNGKFHILNWLAILLENRIFTINSEVSRLAREYILKIFLIDYKKYDVIIGYRADDSYFSFAEDYISNQIRIDKLSEAMYLGKLGIQVFIQSDKAFNHIKFISSKTVDEEEHYPKYIKRDQDARDVYTTSKAIDPLSGIFVRDLLKGGVTNEDTSLPRILFK